MWDQEPCEVDGIEELAPFEEFSHHALYKTVQHLVRKVNKIVTDLTALQAAVTAAQEADTAASTELASLAEKVAGLEAGNVTQDQIDAITADLTNATNTLVSATQPATDTPPADDTPVEPDASQDTGVTTTTTTP